MDISDSARIRILDAAEQLFGAAGYTSVTISKICAVSGEPNGSVYHYFGSKAGLLRATLERGMAEFFANMPNVEDLDGTPTERLEEYFAIAADVVSKRVPLFRLFASLQLHQTEAGATVEAIVREAFDRDTGRVVRFIQPVAEAYGVEDPEQCARHLAALALMFLNGLITSAQNPAIDLHIGIAQDLPRFILASVHDWAAKSQLA